eukprot:TRINITY_DN5682_c0_g1_i1.p1 TRINITY_DN5682_c0_g1~~TRINITY_DN5682_c0_g1_i1.p1  ORF type:complete len:460 (+),score=91.51 TRINITY_DN5682_c0_g1_i1:35-1414(+)
MATNEAAVLRLDEEEAVPAYEEDLPLEQEADALTAASSRQAYIKPSAERLQSERRVFKTGVAALVIVALMAALYCRLDVAPERKDSALAASLDFARTVQLNLEASAENQSTANIDAAINRFLEESAEDAKALPTAMCVTDVLQAAAMIGQVGNIINAANHDCEDWKNLNKAYKQQQVQHLQDIGLMKNWLNFTDKEIRTSIHNVRHTCDIGISSSLALLTFVASALADAARMCAGSIDPVKVASSPLYAEAGCAQDITLAASGMAYFASGAQTAALACDPNTPLLDKFEALRIALVNRRLKKTVKHLPAYAQDLGPLGQFLLQHQDEIEQYRNKRQDQAWKEEQAACAFDVFGATTFTAAGGIFIDVASQECVAGMTKTQDGKMGCSLDVNAVIGMFLSVAGQAGVLMGECAAPDDKPNATNLLQGLCSSGILNMLSSAAFMAAGFSDVKRSCGAIKQR